MRKKLIYFTRNKLVYFLSLLLGTISGLFGVIGALGLCSTSLMVALFGLVGLNSMLLSTYNWLFLLVSVFAFCLAALVFLLRKDKCSLAESEMKKSKVVFKWGGVFGLLALTAVNVVMVFGNRTSLKTNPPALKTGQETADQEINAYLRFKQIKASVIPSGVPQIYGQELNISFDRAQEAIDTVSPFDPSYGSQKIILTGYDMERYKKIGQEIACEYCCGAKTLVFENGEAACGCDHSQMMRGLAAYLLKNHPEFSDEQILGELKKWKAVFFPQQTLTAKIGELEKAGEPGIKELLEEFPDFLPKMVGGC